jgi:hypothetical protein
MMTNSGPAWWKDQFNLSEHGNSYEGLWWPLIREEFPEYESIWRGHVVATTNRIDSTMLRNDAGLPSPDRYLSQPALIQIRRYRRAYVHSARIGRGWHVPEDHIPK